MKNEKLQQLIDDTIEAKINYFALKDKLVKEYERRFGYIPSQVDDDFFIDTIDYPQGNSMTVAEMTEHAKGRTPQW